MTWRYNKSTENRIRWGQHSGIGFKFLKAVAKNFILLQVLFLCLFAYVFGALYLQTTHTHNINIALLDYDGGAIGSAIKAAYESLGGDGFPTLQEVSPSEFPQPSDLLSAVCSTRYWAGLYVSSGASDRLENALGGGSPALVYNRSDIITLIWNQARYSTVVDGAVFSNMQTLSNTARIIYSTADRTGALQNFTDTEVLSVFANPWILSSVNIQPTTQGSRAIYNTLVIILILIQDFFYLGTINGIYANLKIYARIHPLRIITMRFLNSLVYCMVGSLCVAGMIWAFRSGWNVDGDQWALTWITLWLFAHLNFQVLDVFTIWLPVPYVPMALISWVVLNVTSILLPFELSPAFYRVGYMFPAHEVYETLLNIWSSGCNPHLQYSVPILFAWEIVALVLSVLGVFRRSHYATIAEEQQAKQFDDRLKVAEEFQRGEDAKLQTPIGSAAQKDQVAIDADKETSLENGATRQRLAAIINKEEREEAQIRRTLSRTCNFGPSFNMPFVGDDTDSDDTRSLK
ncbi:hypothetical protein BKA67DRAFT_531791 [Truncatella angustata]|uniref:DUF3533 domain-containing protein n=1 Tax=Truncatella angustata TaxID=152316 RepID=A0A9P9A0W3_9PEZI|nr:uncharacterized protein BKA67DRAFT_531791 [Truncatella angustata]KAH6656526.1 hypothetical protein BKA67DRAFT_531791 [Truncatella angustata]KAH8194368.1 hypothetical protein TruAng_011466 [Truncatella angustata]